MTRLHTLAAALLIVGSLVGSTLMAAPVGTSITIPARGDLDNNGILDFTDCAIFGNIFRGSESLSVPEDCLDANADGNVGMLDLLFMFQTVLRSETRAVHAPQETYLSGDIDGNYVLNSQDVLLLRQYVSSETPGSFRVSVGDIDGDGDLDQHDVILLQQSI